MKQHLEPLAVAANVIQSSHCHLDQVLLTFGYLVMQYRAITDHQGAQVIMNSIEKCWAAADQEIFIAAVILNPFYQNSPFAPLHFLNNAGIHALLNGLWSHFYNEDPPAPFSQQIAEYLQQTGLFTNLNSSIQIHLSANSQEICLLCLQMWMCPNDRKWFRLNPQMHSHHTRISNLRDTNWSHLSILPSAFCLFVPTQHNVNGCSAYLAIF